MDSDGCPMGPFTAKCADSAHLTPQQMLKNAIPSFPANFAAQLPNSRPNFLPTADSSSFSAKIFQINAIQNTATKRLQVNNNGNGSSAQCHVSGQGVVAVQQTSAVCKIAAIEEPSDSGNETSSLSPGHTPMTVSSPTHSLSSRSNSFSVSNILRVQQQLRFGQKERTDKGTTDKGTTDKGTTELGEEKKWEETATHCQPKSVQMNGTTKALADPPQPFQPHAPFGNHCAIASTPFGHPLHSAFRAPAVCGAFSAPLHPSVAHPLGSVFPFHPPPGVVFSSGAPRAASVSSAIAPFFFAPSPSSSHGINPLFLSNSAALLSLLHQQQQQHQNECCVVCGDRASGHHYGVQSCEGCKGFFRRAIQNGVQFACSKKEKCVVDKVSRNRCQKCRLAKCLRVGMQQTHVRLEKNRKRKSDSEQRDVGLESTRQAIELINAVVMAFKSSFLTLVDTNSATSAQLLNMPNLKTARHHCQLFVEAIPTFGALNSDTLLSSDVVSAVMIVLLVLLKADDGNQHKALQLREEQLGRVRQCFAELELHWEEVAVFISVVITFYCRSERVQQLYKSLCQGLLIKLSDRNAEDGENVNPSDINTKAIDLYTKLVTNISQLF